MKFLGKIQLGKQGITENFVKSLKNRFKTHENIKVCVLKSAGHSKEKVRGYSDGILEKLNSRPRTKDNDGDTSTTKSLGKNYTSRIIGFTICLKKWRKARE